MPGYAVTYQDGTGANKAPDARNAYDGEQITNSLIRITLPSTGGAGTAAYYGAGTGLLVLAAGWFVWSQRKRYRGDGI